jgi:hypothetical protein
MENENTIGGKIGTFVGGIGNKVSDAANDIGQTVECALDIVKDKAGNLIGLIKDKAGNVLEKVTNKESIDNIVQGVRKAGRIALFASALGVVLGISSCTTTNTLTYGELAPTPNRGTTITIPNAKKGYVEKQEEVTTHIIMADPGLTAEFKASNINLEQTPEFMSGAHAGVKGAPDANKMRQIRNDNVIDVLNSVSGSYLERAFSYEETRRLRDDKINPLHFTFEQCRSTALADAQANPTKKEMYNVGIQIIQLDEQTDFLENLRFVR